MIRVCSPPSASHGHQTQGGHGQTKHSNCPAHSAGGPTGPHAAQVAAFDGQREDLACGNPHGERAECGHLGPRRIHVGLDSAVTQPAKHIGRRTAELKPGSVAELERTGALLKERFGSGVGIDAITADGADDWRSWLTGRHMAEATVRKHTRNAKTVFGEAVERELIPKNSF